MFLIIKFLFCRILVHNREFVLNQAGRFSVYMGKEFTHINEQGRGRMVDVTPKEETLREAVARAVVAMQQETWKRIRDQQIEKGDVLGIAQIAGIMAAKQTGNIIPLCHPLTLTSVDIEFTLGDPERSALEIVSRVKTTGKTGVEMEALTAVTVAALTVYDMCKAIDRQMEIREVCLLEKTGGKSGTFRREG